MTDHPDRQAYAPAEFIAGWYYGLSGHDKRAKVHECFVADRKLTNKLYNAMESYIAGDRKSGDAFMAQTRPLFNNALSRCDQLDSHVKDWARRIDEMMARSDWEQFALKVYKTNKREVERNIDLELREWQQGQFFNSGLFGGQLEKVFLDEQEDGQDLVMHF